MSNEYFVSGTGPGMVGVLDSGGAEVVAGYVPYVADMVLKKIGRVLFTGSDAIGRAAPGDGFIASTKFITGASGRRARRAARAVRGDRLHQEQSGRGLQADGRIREGRRGLGALFVREESDRRRVELCARRRGHRRDRGASRRSWISRRPDVDLPTFAKKFNNTSLREQVQRPSSASVRCRGDPSAARRFAASTARRVRR